MLADGYDLSRRGSVSIAVRVPRERAEQLREAASASGVDVSTYMRDALFNAPTLTMAAVNKIQRHAAAAERELAETQMQSLRDELTRAFADRATAYEQLATLEADLDQGSLRLLVLSRRVLRGETATREQFAEVWGRLDPTTQAYLVPAMILAIREFVLAVPEAQSREDLPRQQRVVADVDWLITRLADAPAASAPPGPEPVTNAPVIASETALAVACADAEDPLLGAGGAVRSLDHSLDGSHSGARFDGPKAVEPGQVAGATPLGGLEGVASECVLQAPTDPVWTTPIVVDATAVSASPVAAPLGRADASTRAPLAARSGSERSEVEAKEMDAHAAGDLPAPPPPEAQQAWAKNASWMPIKSEASADMWL